MDLASMIKPATAVSDWPLEVHPGTAAVMVAKGQVTGVLPEGTHRRGSLVIPFTGSKSIVLFSLKEAMQSETVVLPLPDGSRPTLQIQFNVRCGSDNKALTNAVRRYEHSDIAAMVGAELRAAIEERLRQNLGHFAHDALTTRPSIRDLAGIEGVSVAEGLVTITRLLSLTVEPDPHKQKIEQAQAEGKAKIAVHGIDADVEDAQAVRKHQREAMIQRLSDRQLVDLSREIGVPYLYLRDRDLYREELQMRASFFEKALQSESFPRLAASLGMSTPDLNALVQGLAPGQQAPELAQKAGASPLSRLRFDPSLDEVLDEVGLAEQVAGSSVLIDRPDDGPASGDVVLVSLDPDFLRTAESRFRPVAASRLALPDTYWHYVPYRDELGQFIEDYLPAVLPRRALQGVTISVSELQEAGQTLKVRLNVQGATLKEITGSLIGKRGRQVKLLQKLLPYRRVEYTE